MSNVIGLSGPQGAGKTTLLNGLKARGYYVDAYKVSRDVQERRGWDNLDRVKESATAMVSFQTAILEAKAHHDARLNEHTDVEIILTERTFADIAAYANLWAWELAFLGKWGMNDAIDFSKQFTDDCSSLQKIYSGVVLLPFMPHIAWQADPHRAAQKDVDFISGELESFFRVKHPLAIPVFNVTAGSVDDRINQVDTWIQTLKTEAQS